MAKLNLVGLVVSQGKMNKTVKVRVQGKTYDKRIHKEVIKRKDYLAHDEGNLCKEGDVVRIEAIDRISPRKTFAIAEIQENKGQQFALYLTMASKRLVEEEQRKVAQFTSNQELLAKTITQIEDLRKLNEFSVQGEVAETETQREELLTEINRIKTKYGIKSWPNTEPVVQLEVNEHASELEARKLRFNEIYEKLMTDEFKEKREEILKSLTKTPVEKLQKNTAKNILRKWIDEGNTA